MGSFEFILLRWFCFGILCLLDLDLWDSKLCEDLCDLLCFGILCLLDMDFWDNKLCEDMCEKIEVFDIMWEKGWSC